MFAPYWRFQACCYYLRLRLGVAKKYNNMLNSENRQSDGLRLYNSIHLFLLLILAYVVILSATNNSLLAIDNDITQGIKYVTALSIYKVVILYFTEAGPDADLYLSLLYLVFTAIFINIHLATKNNNAIYLHDIAFCNWDSFSGVIGAHIYSVLYPKLHLDSKENYARYYSSSSNKTLNDFLIEQLDNQGTHSYFTFMFLAGFVALPLLAVWQIDATSTRYSFWLMCFLMVYFQAKTIFEGFLIYKAFFNTK